jgi:hypothetical protein
VKPEKRSFVVFLSPGTFVSEQSERPIEAWDPKAAMGLAEQIVERHNARPYGFYFVERLVAPPIPDGQGGTMEVQPKDIKESGVYYIDGTLRTVDQVQAAADPSESILLSNMEFNEWPIVVTTARSWKYTAIFREEDFVVGPDGSIVERGDDPRHVAYRASKAEVRS